MAAIIKIGKNDEALWNHHREIIERLYIKEQRQLERENGVIEYMKQHHDFIASKSQYEIHFKKWRLRKNLSKSEWRKIIQFMNEKGVSSETHQLRLNQTALPKERILREIARYGLRQNGEEGLCELPEGVTLRPITDVIYWDTRIASPQHDTIATQGDSDQIVAETIPSSACQDIYPSHLAHCMPFLWIGNMDWGQLSGSLSSSQELTIWKAPTAMQLQSAFHPRFIASMALPKADAKMILPLYLATSLLNNMTQSMSLKTDYACGWLKALPPAAIHGFIQNLPAVLLSVARERIFAAALVAGDVNAVLSMLALEVDPREQVNIKAYLSNIPERPFTVALRLNDLAVAKVIAVNLSRIATPSQLNDLFREAYEALIQQSRHPGRYSQSSYYSDATEILCTILSAGARPYAKAIKIANGDIHLAKKLIKKSNVRAWLEVGLLDFLLSAGDLRGDSGLTVWFRETMFRYILDEHLDQLPTGDPGFKLVLVKALNYAARKEITWAMEKASHTFLALGYSVAESDCPQSVSNTILQAIHNADWRFLESIFSIHTPPEILGEREQATGEIDDDQTQLKELVDDFIEASRKNGVNNDIEFETMYWPGYSHTNTTILDSLVWEVFSIAAQRGHDELALTMIRKWPRYKIMAINSMLPYGRIAVISTMVMSDIQLKVAIDTIHERGDPAALSSLVYGDSETSFSIEHSFSCSDSFSTRAQSQRTLRLLAYHAIEKDDYILCKWLLESGMDTRELAHHGNYLSSDRRSLPRPLGVFKEEHGGLWPSLLALASQHDHVGWIEFLLTEGVDSRDSMALYWAIKYGAADTTIDILLEAANAQKSSPRKTYGSEALREAVRRRDLVLIRKLCKIVDIDGVESSYEYDIPMSWEMSPMAEAIIMNDIDLVYVLLQNGASPNAYVAYDGLRISRHFSSELTRATPLLAAIDAQNLPMIKLLVEQGADIDHARKVGMRRTPLQRAAEIGNFDIVHYLISQGAPIDTTPIYSAATELQLAAMNGYVGIATFLLESKANPNYPPAKGKGRTAFEAAAEWSRVDMMSLLIQWGVQLDMKVGEDGKSQYERARSFAEKNGFMASKRYVEYLYREVKESRNRDDVQMQGATEPLIVQMEAEASSG
ncbi:hypothetical protein GQ44DRAFT_818173 [Phaeosphaeriaceae sp. PMI808]|nr:hypothetical protein GQ44DRAFT_818173 [Phaeosphaeriaceae sp. PMI808]